MSTVVAPSETVLLDELEQDDELTKDLMKARELIRKGWVQHKMAQRNIFGHPKFCVLGSFNHVRRSDEYGQLQMMRMFAAANNLHPQNIPAWNDHVLRVHSHVLTAFDRAIALARKRARKDGSRFA